MKRTIKPYYVLNWDFNRDKIEYYDIMPYFIDVYKKLKKSRSKNVTVPTTYDEIKEFIIKESQYMFWSRCEYEVLIYDWPKSESCHKLDIHEQIMMNIDVITNHFILHL